MSEYYLSIDVEADGPIPGPHSMLSIGAAIFKGLGSRDPISTFSANLELLPGAEMDPDTKKFWDKNPSAYAECRKNPASPESVMTDFVSWVEEQCETKRPACVGYPVTYDFMFVYWYCLKFAGRSPFGFQGLDMKTLAAHKMGVPFHRATKRKMPRKWFEGCDRHNHVAVDDAIEQGVLFINMMNDKG
jgi:hypothetical protein